MTTRDDHPADMSSIENRLPSMGAVFFDRVRETPNAEAYRFPDGAGGWQSRTWAETGDEVRRIAAGLIALGVEAEQRVAIASVLVMNPQVLLFDEPTAGLDPRTQQWLMDLIGELNGAGKTVVLATHDLDVLETLADRCLVFGEDHTIVATGTPRQILDDTDLLLRTNLALRPRVAP